MLRITLSLLLLLSALALTPAASPLIQADDPLIVETFEAGGGTHDARRPDTPDAELALQAAREAVERSIDLFQPLWVDTTGIIPFAYFVDVKDERFPGRPEVIADASIITSAELPEDVLAANRHRRPAQICRIHIYLPALLPEEEVSLFHMTHEIAHCYQSFHDPELLDMAEAVRGWWVEGSANWMASLAYPSGAAAVLPEWHDTFVSRYRTSMFNRSYDNAFYWIFLASELGDEQAVVDFIKDMHGLDSLDEYSGYLNTVAPDADGYTHAFALALAQEQVDHQPSPDDLFTGQAISAADLPADVSLVAVGDYAMEFITLTVTDLEEGEGLVLQPVNFFENASRISVWNRLTSDGFIALDDDAETEFCPGASEMVVDLVISRAASSTSGTRPDRQLQVNVVECDDEPEFTQVPECIIGTWDVIALPELNVSGMDSPVYTWDTFQIIFDADGSMTGEVTNMSTSMVIPDTTMNLEVSVSASGMSGILSYAPEGTTDGRYLTEMADWNIGMYSAFANVGGQMMDLTPMIDAMLSEPGLMGMQPPSYIDCIGDVQLEYWVLDEYLIGPYILTRAG